MNNFTNRAFGIEIEFVGASLNSVAVAINRAGVDCEVEFYNHNTRPHWKIVTDASLRSVNGHAGELVSPILKGEQGIRELKTVLEALNSVEGVQVNVSCGMHVHLDVRDMTAKEIKTVFERYAKYESQIDLIMPRSRRNSPRWCATLQESVVSNYVGMADSKSELANAIGRYYKVNLSNVHTRGSIEFRQHSGTTEFRKISNWLAFLQQFVEKSIQIANKKNVDLGKVKNRKSRPYDAPRDVCQKLGIEMTYAGGSKWTLTKGSESITIANSEISHHYSEGRVFRTNDWIFLLNCLFVQEVMEQESDNGYTDGVCQSTKIYIEERLEELN